MEEQYFMITCNDDGEVRVAQVSKEMILGDLKLGDMQAEEFIDNVKEADPNLWRANRLLIKGRIITPKPISRVTEYELE